MDDYRKKLELFQRWVSGQDYDVPLEQADADAIEAYVVYLKDGRGMADSSRKNHLEVDDPRLSRDEEEIRVAYGKGNKERHIPMNEKLRRSLRRYLRVRDGLIPALTETPLPHLFVNNKGGRISENTVRRTLCKYVRKSGIRKTDVKPHDLRRTFATWFLQENLDQARELAELMGHSDLSQVMKYALSDEKRARAGVAKL